LNIRAARRSDKEYILKFCINTFNWGDYVDRVIDLWYREPNGKLYVADFNRAHKQRQIVPTTNTHNTTRGPIALSHVVLCPNHHWAWIEGIRVHPKYRRHKVATALIGKMLEFGKLHGATEAYAIISDDNIASQSLFRNHNFDRVSEWVYYNIHVHHKTYQNRNKKNKKNKNTTRMASCDDIDNVWDYLTFSEIYKLSGRRYFSAWRWYPLDYERIVDFTKQQRLILVQNSNSLVEGLAIVEKTGGWANADILQLVYLDASSIFIIRDLISYSSNVYIPTISNNNNNNENNVNGNSINQLIIISYHTNQLSTIMRTYRIKESARFFLYGRRL
jgi:ribosomal protein S18 acetylase RimI-like enzyme